MEDMKLSLFADDYPHRKSQGITKNLLKTIK